jgi:hypothetical protein
VEIGSSGPPYTNIKLIYPEVVIELPEIFVGTNSFKLKTTGYNGETATNNVYNANISINEQTTYTNFIN